MTKYDYRITESPTGTPTFAALEPTGGFGAYGRGRGNGGARRGSGVGHGREGFPRGTHLDVMRPTAGGVHLRVPCVTPSQTDGSNVDFGRRDGTLFEPTTAQLSAL